ncbi:hypothetical protein RJT34_09371 [Clitoria ternatea]|uniref:Uncharacterized protein n=1 Tax=Clitoria ternatea TaxID=43366 RepID=A0AAN9K6U1_CLITE
MAEACDSSFFQDSQGVKGCDGDARWEGGGDGLEGGQGGGDGDGDGDGVGGCEGGGGGNWPLLRHFGCRELE